MRATTDADDIRDEAPLPDADDAVVAFLVVDLDGEYPSAHDASHLEGLDDHDCALRDDASHLAGDM